MKYRRRWHKLNNTGSAIVTILVVVTFLTILATVMLYISGVNYQMKVTDYHTKESFYQAETPVEELRAQLVKDTEAAFAEAYTAAMSEYSSMDATSREANYRQLFCEVMNRIWYDRCGYIPESTNLDWTAGISAVVQPATGGAFWNVEITSSAGEWDSDLAISQGQLILEGVTFTYDSPSQYTSIISTDYCITIPWVNWSDDYTEIALMEESQLDFSDCVNYMNWTKR